MSGTRFVDAEEQRTKRQLRAEIARLRRGVDGRVSAVGHEASRLACWRTYVRRFPAAALAAAFGVGMVVSAGRTGSLASRWLSHKLVVAAWNAATGQLWRELAALGSQTKGPKTG